MEKILCDEHYRTDVLHDFRAFSTLVSNLGGEKVLFGAKDRDMSRYNIMVYLLDGVAILSNNYDVYVHPVCPRDCKIKVSLIGEELSVLYVEKKIKDAGAKFRETENKKSLEQLV